MKKLMKEITTIPVAIRRNQITAIQVAMLVPVTVLASLGILNLLQAIFN